MKKPKRKWSLPIIRKVFCGAECKADEHKVSSCSQSIPRGRLGQFVKKTNITTLSAKIPNSEAPFCYCQWLFSSSLLTNLVLLLLLTAVAVAVISFLLSYQGYQCLTSIYSFQLKSYPEVLVVENTSEYFRRFQ